MLTLRHPYSDAQNAVYSTWHGHGSVTELSFIATCSLQSNASGLLVCKGLCSQICYFPKLIKESTLQHLVKFDSDSHAKPKWTIAP